MENSMKENEQVVVEVQVQENAAGEAQYVANCPKCGATLRLKGKGFAHLCPVCSTVLKVKLSPKVEEEVKEDKSLHFVLSEEAVNYLIRKENEWINSKAGKKAAKAEAKKAKKNPNYVPPQNLQTLLSQAAEAGYTAEDSLLIDVDANGFFVSKK